VKRFSKLSLCILTVAFVFMLNGYALALPIISSAELNGTPTVIDFSQFTGANQHFGVTGPIQIGGLVGRDVTASSTTSGLYLYNGYWDLLGNGAWNSGRNGYLGVWPTGDVEIKFNFGTDLVSGFGTFMNYIPAKYVPVMIVAYDVMGNLIEMFNVGMGSPISTPGELNKGSFLGIQRSQADIASVTVFGRGIVLDNVSFTSESTTPVPEPGTIFLLAGSLLAMSGVKRKERE